MDERVVTSSALASSREAPAVPKCRRIAAEAVLVRRVTLDSLAGEEPGELQSPLSASVLGTGTVPPGELRVICSWCDEVMREGSGAAGALTSHSICPTCYALVVAA